jgi:hypothetical protein
MQKSGIAANIKSDYSQQFGTRSKVLVKPNTEAPPEGKFDTHPAEPEPAVTEVASS